MASEIPHAPPVATVGAAISQMNTVAAALPESDGVACFNRMYLEVTEQVQEMLSQGSFGDPAWLSALDVSFANIYFAAVEAAAADPPASIPVAWQPLFAARGNTEITSLQFALAGMNAHINHDLPIAVVQTCRALGTDPDGGTHHADYQKVDTLLDAAEQSIRRSFESGAALATDRRLQAVLDLVGNWTINAARDVAWDTSVALWQCRAMPAVEDLMMAALARTVAMASRCLLAPVA